MSGWGCRYQYEEQCLRMRKACKPGMPGCVLRGKVRFISEVERERPAPSAKKPPATPARARKPRGADRKA